MENIILSNQEQLFLHKEFINFWLERILEGDELFIKLALILED